MSAEWITLIALIAGGLAAWWVRGVLAKTATANLEARLASAEQQLAERARELEALRDERQRLLEALRAESERRATAEAQAARLPGLEAGLTERERDLTESKAKLAELETRLAEERKAAEEKLALLDEAQRKLSDAFKALCAEALQSNNQSFLDLAKATLEKFQESAKSDLEARQKAVDELVRPLRESLEKVDGKLGELEKARVSAYAALHEQLKSLVDTHLPMLRAETANLVKALRQPTVRGRWGEIQLKRVVEMAGMVEYCDFVEQESRATEDGRLRPDLIVRLPGGKQIVVDAKAPLEAYLRAVDATDDETRQRHLADHARQVRDHMSALGRKAYWGQFDPTPEFVVLFLPGEMFFSAALQQDPGLIEFGVNERVIPATPTTLIALLRAVAYGWRQEALARNAQEVADLGRQLYERIAKLADHWANVGDKLGKAVDAYNSATSTLETRVLVSARRLRDLKAAPEGVEIEAIEPVELTPRALRAAPLSSSVSNDDPQ
ncbi:DNA recombination protein RmuC [Pelomicrobium methylotrophicum]|uniref:DNA recombination protein RmuC n=1 Tax=Pelomicrobium methylotrophicum TaxID=2602750 RepID=UPI001969CBAD|nr:DNA recombination protein RmuC [Pelomicrobium methylotrophicum]